MPPRTRAGWGAWRCAGDNPQLSLNFPTLDGFPRGGPLRTRSPTPPAGEAAGQRLRGDTVCSARPCLSEACPRGPQFFSVPPASSSCGVLYGQTLTQRTVMWGSRGAKFHHT